MPLFCISSSLRLSIDLRVLPKNLVESDLNIDTGRMADYLPVDEWEQIGNNTLLYTDELLDSFDKKMENNACNTYAAKYQLINMKENYVQT